MNNIIENLVIAILSFILGILVLKLIQTKPIKEEENGLTTNN